VIGESCFLDCKLLVWISFESKSKLSRIEREAFCRTSLRSFHLPASVLVVFELFFSDCKLLESVTFESDSRLSRIERGALHGSGLKSIPLPVSVLEICDSCFWSSTFGGLVSFAPDSKLPWIEREVFRESGLKSIHPRSRECVLLSRLPPNSMKNRFYDSASALLQQPRTLSPTRMGARPLCPPSNGT
jgi:hypothetical protein